MSKREKSLALFLGIVFAILVVIPGIWKFMSQPIKTEQTRLDLAEKRFDAEQLRYDSARLKIQKMAQYKARSLSSNASQGAGAYQQWLTDLAEMHFTGKRPKVDPERITAARDNSSVTVRLKVSGEGTLEQLRNFLYRYYRANVLHQIVSLSIEAQDNSATPRLNITFMSEALSLRDAPIKGATLFPRTTVVDDIKSGATELKVASAKEFPEKAPFEIRLGNQYVNVTGIASDVWTIDSNAKLSAVASGTLVELSPVHPDFATKTVDDYTKLIKLNPFAKPVPYRPRLDLTGDKSVIRGGSLSLEVRASGFDNRSGAATYEAVGELPAGMKLADGKLTWKPAEDAVAGAFKIKLKATALGLKEPLISDFELTLKDVNAPPKITPPGSLVATLGQLLKVKVAATDTETPAEQLKFKLADPAPEGAAINETTGELTYTPAATSQPGAITINVTVTDLGTPPQSATLPISISVQDDTAVFTFLTGIVAADDQRRAFLYDRSANRTIILLEQKMLKYAGIEGQVKSITKDSVVLQQKDQLLRISLGENLRNAKAEPLAAEPKLGTPPTEPPLPEGRVEKTA